MDLDRGFPGKFDSRTLGRETLNRGIGRTGGVVACATSNRVENCNKAAAEQVKR